jgi:hypothetical protein
MEQEAAVAEAILGPILAELAPDVVIFKNFEPPESFTAHLPVLLRKFTAAFPRTDWIFNLMHQMGKGTNTAPNAALRAVALAHGQSVHDDTTWSGTFAYAHERFWMREDIHRSIMGNELAVELMLSQSPIGQGVGLGESLLPGVLPVFRVTQSTPTPLIKGDFTRVRFDVPYRDQNGVFDRGDAPVQSARRRLV